MAIRPVFVPDKTHLGVIKKDIEFKWHPGMSKTQKQKSVIELHKSAQQCGINNILEVSTKSQNNIGSALSAFNLKFTTQKYHKTFTVESAFQGSKVFRNGGPYKDIFFFQPKAAKRDTRLKESGKLTSFKFFNYVFSLNPTTFFYDWLYINALSQNNELTQSLFNYDGFTDIEFNPNKSVNCQAHSVALFISLKCNMEKINLIKNPDDFYELTKKYYDSYLKIF